MGSGYKNSTIFVTVPTQPHYFLDFVSVYRYNNDGDYYEYQ